MLLLLSRLLLLISLLGACISGAQAQAWSISGSVHDSVTGEPLAFVSIVVNNSRLGGRSDIDGRFNISSPEKPLFLRLSYLGYRNDTVWLSHGCDKLSLTLAPVKYELSEVVILPGENPALRIVRKVIENSDQNNPGKYPSYRCHSYNKITAEWLPNEKYYQALDKMKTDSNALDSALIRLVESGPDQHLMMMESDTRRYFLLPARNREEIMATRVSGFTNPNFAPLATDLQPFSFYEEEINLNTGTVTGYQNPFGKGGLPRYHYLIEDTLYEGADSIYVISFRPEKGKSFNALQGIAYINTNGYAIQNVIAEPPDGILWKIKIQQQYRLVNGSRWFPEQLNYDWILPKYPDEKVGLLLKGRSYIDQVEIGIELHPSDFGPDQVSLADSAGNRDSTYWSLHRPDTLNRVEWRTYQVMDSLGKKMNLDYYTRAAPAVMEGFLPIGPLDLAFDKLYTYNSYEGHRLGLGLRSGEKISGWFCLGGYFGYGLKDKTFKYGGDLLLRAWRKHDLEFFVRYSAELEEPGSSSLYGYGNASYWFGMIGENYDMTGHYQGGVRFRTLKYLEAGLSFHHTGLDPCYIYRFLPGVPDSTTPEADTSFIFSEAVLALRYTVRDELTRAFGRRFSMGSRYPTFFASYTCGFKNVLKSDYEYHKLELAAMQDFRIRNFGKTSMRAEAGIIGGEVPYPRLFRGRGSYGGDISFLLNNSFQTMRPDEFACDRYVNFFFRHNFGNFLFKAGKFKPEFIVAHNLMFGALRHPEQHEGLTFKAPSLGFYEAGLVIDNLIRLKLLNVAYLGLGVGAYYRYGAYSLDKTIRNFAFKLSFRVSGD